MKKLNKILVATDFTSAARDALQTAVAAANVFRSQLLLLHVIPVTPDRPGPLMQVQAAVQQQLDTLAAATATAGGRIAKTLVAQGSAFDQIIQVADAEAVNVIVVGSEEKAPDDPFRLGVTPERLIRKANQPVWVVKPGRAAVPRRVLCAVDFSPASRRALTNAILFARQLDADLRVVHVLDTALAAFADKLAPAHADLARQSQEQQATFDQFLAGFDLSGVRCTPELRAGNPPHEILAASRTGGTDLLVLGSVGRTGLSRILLGSVAEKVVRELPCSVITVKTESAF